MSQWAVLIFLLLIALCITGVVYVRCREQLGDGKVRLRDVLGYILETILELLGG